MSGRKSFVWLFVGFLLTATGVHASCPIELSPPSVVLKYGDSVSINCSTSETKFAGIGWEVPIGGTGLEEVNHLTWAVENLTDWNISPQCFINPSSESQFGQCFSEPKIVLYTFPEDISIGSIDVFDGAMTENKNFEITCGINNIAPVQNLNVIWYKGDTIVHTESLNNAQKSPVNLSPVYNFEPTRKDDGVTFRCEAHMDLGPEGPQFNVSSQEYKIKVYFGPDVECSAPELLEGDTLEKLCSVTGNPDPVVIWLKDGQVTDRTIPLMRGDEGNYTINAEGYSSITKELQVYVLYGPELTFQSSYTAPENTPLNLTCNAVGYPEPEIIWSKEGEEVELPQILTRHDAGQYMITASNSRSSVNHTVEITVLYSPSPILELEDSEVDVGSTVGLKCSSMGNPRPKYSWTYFRTANVMETNEDGVSRLLIRNATAYNMGSYTCHAWNDRGNVSQTARVTVRGADRVCPVVITPDRMVIQYRDSTPSVKCQPIPTASRNVKEIPYWEVPQGNSTKMVTWEPDTQNDWDPRPACTGMFDGMEKCQKLLDYTLYKKPDSVSILLVDDAGPVVEAVDFQLQCDITNVAPARNLAVRWYIGNENFTSNETMQVTGCFPWNNIDCDLNVTRSPMNVSQTLNVRLNRTHNGAEIKCEAVLELGENGPNPPPSEMSSPINITVFYKPSINTTDLPDTVPLFRGYVEDLVCIADGNPPPEIQWLNSQDNLVPGNILKVNEAGVYNCSARNKVGSVSYAVKVILKEDYLPLIAGFVAVAVVAISIVFLFIYSIYYKNTKMRRYNLKNAKLSTHNGNVAHNGWDMQFPMTKLS
ncbi:hemicentin-2-like [Acanthopagrus latus]|uniref:hemicentin-2-like n=1 Tax=Acanthopagrus latus TaxID=8177 RepID=UPI00187CF85D|nr:hemicentin-2-like [Acanthopagrus latus]